MSAEEWMRIDECRVISPLILLLIGKKHLDRALLKTFSIIANSSHLGQSYILHQPSKGVE
jgi:hypothetical protein